MKTFKKLSYVGPRVVLTGIPIKQIIISNGIIKPGDIYENSEFSGYIGLKIGHCMDSCYMNHEWIPIIIGFRDKGILIIKTRKGYKKQAFRRNLIKISMKRYKLEKKIKKPIKTIRKKIRYYYMKLFWSQEKLTRKFSEQTDRRLALGNKSSYLFWATESGFRPEPVDPHEPSGVVFDRCNNIDPHLIESHEPFNPVLTHGFIEGGIVSADFRHNLDHLAVSGIRTEEQNLFEQNINLENDYIDAVREGLNNLRDAVHRPNPVIMSGGLVNTTNIIFRQLTKDYPHKCFNSKCNRELRFIEILEANRDMDRAHLEKLWKSKYVHFYCCRCYKMKQNEKIFEEFKEKYLKDKKAIEFMAGAGADNDLTAFLDFYYTFINAKRKLKAGKITVLSNSHVMHKCISNIRPFLGFKNDEKIACYVNEFEYITHFSWFEKWEIDDDLPNMLIIYGNNQILYTRMLTLNGHNINWIG